ncbi:MAG: hypothetical protein M3Y27_25195 [Acidobacteriota bacterium]|nr:hypothetical protein [Acidobacteriota bacterium]
MCFSATANFAGSAVLGAIGVATLAEVKHPRQLLFAAMPLLFAIHQFIEGFVWLGLHNILPANVTNEAGAAYVMYAQGLLPFLLPLSVLLIEPTVHRRRRMLGFALLGGVMALYLTWGLIAYPMQVSERHHSIIYLNPVTNTTMVAVLYVIATCGALFFSGFGDLVVLGAANLAGLLVVMLVMRYAFTSVWCAYAAVVSVLIYFHFRQRRLLPVRYALAK